MSLSNLDRSDAEARELAAALARDVAALHARGCVHGRLHPGNVHVVAGGAIVLAEGGLPFRPELAEAAELGFAAPEVLRGGAPSRRADAFSLAAIAYALLARRPPFEADSALETIRRVLHDDPVPLDAVRPDLPAGLVAVVSRGLEKRAWRRASAAEIAEEIRAAQPALATSTSTASPEAGHPERSVSAPAERRSRGTPTSTGSLEAGHPERSEAASAAERSRGAPTPTGSLEAGHPERSEAASAAERSRGAPTSSPPPNPNAPRLPPPLVPTLRRALARAPSLGRALLSSPRRVALVALPVLALAALYLPQTDASLASDVASLVASGQLAQARAKLERAAKDRPGDPLVEKLRGDVACARGASGECLRRYRVALAARPALREDPALRENARRLLAGARSCGSRRAAAELLGELRDPAALPALESARRSGGIFSWFCTGDAIDRAIVATRQTRKARAD